MSLPTILTPERSAVVQGVAGAGKTSLRRRLLDSISGLEVGSPGNAKRAFGVEMYGDDLNLPPLRLVAKITEQLPAAALQDHLAVKEVTSVGSQILARRSIYEITDANHGLNEESDLATCLDVLRAAALGQGRGGGARLRRNAEVPPQSTRHRRRQRVERTRLQQGLRDDDVLRVAEYRGGCWKKG